MENHIFKPKEISVFGFLWTRGYIWRFFLDPLAASREPASIFVKTVFQDLKDRDKDMGTLKLTAQERDTPDRAGAAIGVLEREIIFILGIMNQFSAIGFVLAAKSLARFEQLKNKGFAERYLIGTLLSALIAIVCAAVYGLTAP